MEAEGPIQGLHLEPERVARPAEPEDGEAAEAAPASEGAR